MANPVVTVNVSQDTAPAPSILQKTGALISQGATNTSPGTRSLLTQLSDLTPLLTGSKAISAMNWSGGLVSVTTTLNHGFPIGDLVPVTIAGVTPSGYNGVFVATILSVNSFSYPLPSSPGPVTVQGVYTPEDVAELLAMATTFFAQGQQQSVYALELGPTGVVDGVAFLNTWIQQNPGVFYGYLVPRFWDATATYLAFLAQFTATGSKTYFWTTTTLATYQAYAATLKCVFALIEAPPYGVWAANVLTSISWVSGTVTALTTTNHGVQPGQYFQLSGNTPSGYNGWFLALPGTTGNTLVFAIASNPGAETALGTLVQSLYSSAGVPATEFSLASVFQTTLNYSPSSTNKVTPLQFAFEVGVTPFPIQGNASLISALLAANISIIGTGAQGNISDTLVRGGHLLDGNPFKYWYSVDWAQINLSVNVTAALIDGANNPQNPVDYNQPGIDTLQQTCVATMQQGISNGLVLNPLRATTLSAKDLNNALANDTFDGFTLVNADPLGSYTAENPNDYAAGTYNGIAVRYTPLRGFESITINVNVSNFASG
jgi:hypothetical protein